MSRLWSRLSSLLRITVLMAVPLFAVLSLAQTGFATAHTKQSREDLRNCYKDCRAAYKAERAACATLKGNARRQCIKDAKMHLKQCRAQCKASFCSAPMIVDGDDFLDMDDDLVTADSGRGNRANGDGRFAQSVVNSSRGRPSRSIRGR